MANPRYWKRGIDSCGRKRGEEGKIERESKNWSSAGRERGNRSLSFSSWWAQKMAENRSPREWIIPYFSRAPIWRAPVVCLPRGCRQLVEDVASPSYRGPAASGGKEASSPTTFLIDDGVLMAPPPRLYDHLLCGCNADRFHRLILNNRMEPSKLAAIHLWQLWKVRRFNAASKVAREDSLMRLFLELQIWWIELFQFFVSIPPVLVYIYMFLIVKSYGDNLMRLDIFITSNLTIELSCFNFSCLSLYIYVSNSDTLKVVEIV